VPYPDNPQSFNRYSYCANNPLNYTDPSGHILDFIFDIGSALYDVYEIVRNPFNWTNWAALGADIGCAFVPVATGGGLAVRGAKQADEAVSLFRHGDDLARMGGRADDIMGVVGKADNAAGSFRYSKFKEIQLKPGTRSYRAYEEGVTNPLGRFTTRGATTRRITSTKAAIGELALEGTSGVRPNRLAALEVTRPVTVRVGFIKGGGKYAIQYVITDPSALIELKELRSVLR